ncbi:hypothetical protein ACFL0H_12785 [Thermodesulfobacteriota bacterium]
MKHEMHYNDGFFEVKTYGDAEPDGFRDIIDHLLAHANWKPGTTFLVNHSELNSGPLSVDDVESIAQMSVRPGAQWGQARCALLVARDLEYGMARMWEVFVEGKWDVIEHLFRSRDKAISWLKDV